MTIKASYEKDNIRLVNCDCIEVMEEIPDNYFDLAVTSPPYNINVEISNGKYKPRNRPSEQITKKYNNYKDDLSMDDYFEFLKKAISELMRVSNLVFFNIQMVTGNKPALFKILGEFSDTIKEVIIWDKTTSEPSIQEGVLNSEYEYIIVFSKDDAMKRSFNTHSFNRGTLTNLWRFGKSRSTDKLNKASFPSAIPDAILSNFSREGYRIIDPFSGTGTTAISAHKHKCGEFLGIELDKEYFDNSINRIEEQTAQLDLF